MKTFRQFLKESSGPLYEMSNAAIDVVRNREIWVENPNGQNNKYFKYTDNTDYTNITKVARISIINPKYMVNHKNSRGVDEWELDKDEKEELIDFLKTDKDAFGFSAWERIILTYNRDNCHIRMDTLQNKNITKTEYNNMVDEYNSKLSVGSKRIRGALRLDFPQPDYHLLPEKKSKNKNKGK